MNPPRDLNYRVAAHHQMNYSRPSQFSGSPNAPQVNYYNYPMHPHPQMQPQQSYTPVHQPPELPFNPTISSPQGSMYHHASPLLHDHSSPENHMHPTAVNFHGQSMNYHPPSHQNASHEMPQSYGYHTKPTNYQVRPAISHAPAYNFAPQSQFNQQQAPQVQMPFPHTGNYPYALDPNRPHTFTPNMYPPSTVNNYQLPRPQVSQEKPFQPQISPLMQVSPHQATPSTATFPSHVHDPMRNQHEQNDRQEQKQPQQVSHHPPHVQHAGNINFSRHQHHHHQHHHHHHQPSQAQPMGQSINTFTSNSSTVSPIKSNHVLPQSSEGSMNPPRTSEATSFTPSIAHKPSSSTDDSARASSSSSEKAKETAAPSQAPSNSKPSPVKSESTVTSGDDCKSKSSSSTFMTPDKSPCKQQLSIPSHEEQMDVDFIRRMMMPSAKERSSSLFTSSSSGDKNNEKVEVKSNEKVESPSGTKKVTDSSTKSIEKSRQRKHSVSTVEKLRKSFSANSPNARTSESIGKKSVTNATVTVQSRSMKGGKNRRKMGQLDDSLSSDETTDLDALDTYQSLIEVEEYNPPSKLNPLINRSMPPVSEEHRKLVDRLRDAKIIEDDSLYKLMMSLDMKLFYEKVSPEWAEHEAVCLERTIKHIQPGHSILVFPYNTYFSVALAVYVGTGGRVVAFGHQGNAFALRSNGLSWLLDDYRIRFTNNTVALYYGYPDYNTYLQCGFPKGAPFDLVVLTDQEITNEIRSQSKIGGIFIRPDEENLFFLNEPVNEASNDPYNTETETETETECEDN